MWDTKLRLICTINGSGTITVNLKNSSILPYIILLSRLYNSWYMCDFHFFNLVVSYRWSTATYSAALSSIHSAHRASLFAFLSFTVLQCRFQMRNRYASEGGFFLWMGLESSLTRKKTFAGFVNGRCHFSLPYMQAQEYSDKGSMNETMLHPWVL